MRADSSWKPALRLFYLCPAWCKPKNYL